MSEKISLLGMSKDALQEVLCSKGYPKWRSDQIWSWMYCKGAKSFEDMTDLPKDMRTACEQQFTIERPKIIKHEHSTDGTEKFALQLQDAEIIEMVFIPEGDRGTLCVSSQVGCAVRCAFCFTGTQGFTRNLEVEEIVGQILLMRDLLDDYATEERRLTNIVMMGMGEPLHNYKNVSIALHIVMDPKGMGFSRRRITLSTSGVTPFLQKCGVDLGVNIAISLHAPNDKLRSQIMPINQQFPLQGLIEVCRNYPGMNPARRITFEYVMLKGINDTDACARELARLLQGIQAKVNMLPWNPWPGAPFETSSPERMDAFSRILTQAGYMVMRRTPRGQDISAACGQLKTADLSPAS